MSDFVCPDHGTAFCPPGDSVEEGGCAHFLAYLDRQIAEAKANNIRRERPARDETRPVNGEQ